VDTVTIRPMDSQDCASVAAWMAATPLWQRYGLTESGAHAALVKGLAAEDLLLVADAESGDGQACGLAWVLRSGAFGRSPYLRILGVKAAYNGRGIGAALLAAVEAETAQFAHEFFLLVSDFNADAQRFYRRQGYVQIGAVPGYVVPDITELIYWKRLALPNRT
jgi:ribosomal protein S18 acetylase RimI-like enzyme